MSSATSSDDSSTSSSSSVASTPPTTPVNECTCVALCSAGADAAHDRRLQVTESATETIARPLLATRTLTKEIQSVACFALNDQEFYFDGNPLMSVYGSAAARARGCNQVERTQFQLLSGLDWDTTTGAERYAATTRLPHDEAMRLELDAFLSWVEDSMYITIAEARIREDLNPGVIEMAEEVRAKSGKPLHAVQPYYVDVMCEFHDHMDAEFDTAKSDPLGCELYSRFRANTHVQPVSLLVLLDMNALFRYVVTPVLDTRAVLGEETKKRIADKAVAEAEAAMRQKAKAKRRKLLA